MCVDRDLSLLIVLLFLKVWTMEHKNSEQIKLEVQEWQITNALIGILGVLAPAACLAFIVGHSGILIDSILNYDHTKPKAPPHHFHRWLTTLIFWPFRSHPPKRFRAQRNGDTRNPVHVWRDGSLLCTLVNTVVPGACKDPREHRLHPPRHGVKLVMEYLNIQPIFTHDELNQPHLTPQQEKQFSKYLHEVHQSISKQTDNFNNMRFSTDYVARGMGLVFGEQNRKSTFYIYPIPKHNQQPCDLEVSIKGPYGNNGLIIIPSILHHQQKWQPPTEYRRAMYMSSKLNSISPTTQGTSFLRKLSLNTISKPQDPSLEIDIRVKISLTRAKVSYVPEKTGVYEVSLITRNCHVVGSPYSVPIELATSNYLSNDSDNESDEANEGKYIKRKKKIISRIVDFIDEKMLLQNDGTLVKIDDGRIQNKNNDNYIATEIKSELVPEKCDTLFETIDEQNLKTELIETVKQEETKLLEPDYLQEKHSEQNCTNNEISTSFISKNNQTQEFQNKSVFKETLRQFNKNIVKEDTSSKSGQNKTKVVHDLPQKYIRNNNKISSTIYANSNDIKPPSNDFNERPIKEISKKYDFKETLDKFNKNILQKEINNESYIKRIKDSNEEATKINDSKIQSANIQTKEIKNRTLIEESNLVSNNSELRSPNKLEENNNIIFNVSRFLNNNTEPNYFTESHININNIDDTIIENLNNSSCFAPDILETPNRNTEKSPSFTKEVNDDKISNNSLKSSCVDPTLVSKVHDPALDFPTLVSQHRKTFSKKDPSKEFIFPASNINSTDKDNNLVNNLVKVFDVPQQECSSRVEQTDEENCLAGNDPDLVQCHINKIDLSNMLQISCDEDYYSIQKEDKNLLLKKLKSIGALFDDYDKSQCYLKDCLKHNIEQYFNDKMSVKTEKTNDVKLGIVDKQKQFWNKKINNSKGLYFSNNSTKQKVTLKNTFVTTTKDNSKTNMECFKPFEGIVENNIKIFETKLASSSPTNTNSVRKCELLNLHKSKSESFLQEPKKNNLYQIQKTFSDEEMSKIPSIEERRKKFLQACQQSVEKKISGEKFEIGSVEPSEEPTIIESKLNSNNITSIEIPDSEQKKPTPKKKEKKHSFKRKARFTRAKIFFHHLEGSDPKINIEEHLKSEHFSKNNKKISRSESDSCVSYHKPTETAIKSLKISDRFQVDDLFQDILGDDKRFIGIPNKLAVVASLASLDSDSNRVEYYSGNEGEPVMDYFTGRPKIIKRQKKIIPGFHEEYPHLPTTDTWRFKSRNDLKTEELIPGRILLTNIQSDSDLNVT